MTDGRELVGRNVRRARKIAALSQQQLAVRLEVERVRVSKWERGVHQPNEVMLERIAEALGHPVWWFHLDHDAAPAITGDLGTMAVIATDLEFRFTAWDHEAERLLGWTAEEVIGQLATDLFPDGDGSREGRARVLRRKGWWHGEVTASGKDGGSVVCEHLAVTLRDGDTAQSYTVLLRAV